MDQTWKVYVPSTLLVFLIVLSVVGLLALTDYRQLKQGVKLTNVSSESSEIKPLFNSESGCKNEPSIILSTKVSIPKCTTMTSTFVSYSAKATPTSYHDKAVIEASKNIKEKVFIPRACTHKRLIEYKQEQKNAYMCRRNGVKSKVNVISLPGDVLPGQTKVFNGPDDVICVCKRPAKKIHFRCQTCVDQYTCPRNLKFPRCKSCEEPKPEPCKITKIVQKKVSVKCTVPKPVVQSCVQPVIPKCVIAPRCEVPVVPKCELPVIPQCEIPAVPKCVKPVVQKCEKPVVSKCKVSLTSQVERTVAFLEENRVSESVTSVTSMVGMASAASVTSVICPISQIFDNETKASSLISISSTIMSSESTSILGASENNAENLIGTLEDSADSKKSVDVDNDKKDQTLDRSGNIKCTVKKGNGANCMDFKWESKEISSHEHKFTDDNGVPHEIKMDVIVKETDSGITKVIRILKNQSWSRWRKSWVSSRKPWGMGFRMRRRMRKMKDVVESDDVRVDGKVLKCWLNVPRNYALDPSNYDGLGSVLVAGKKDDKVLKFCYLIN